MEIGKNGLVRLCIRMTDLDIIERVDAMFPANRISIVTPKPMRETYNQPKTQYAWRISGPKVRGVLELLLPYLGERRTARAREVLHHLATRPGPGGNSVKTHCKAGHEFTPENTYRNPNRPTHRCCKTCRNRWATEYRNRNQDMTGVTRPVPEITAVDFG